MKPNWRLLVPETRRGNRDFLAEKVSPKARQPVLHNPNRLGVVVDQEARAAVFGGGFAEGAGACEKIQQPVAGR